ncbi:MAG TPA: type II secretion system F family protein [Marmoricola sp.]|nr:type II secretion system F family protein [Marmoricola sp.]HNN48933.1 type II secretion system F family protein [Marmoricola sp.]
MSILSQARLRPVIALLGFLAGWAFIGGSTGLVTGLAGAAGLWWFASRIEDPALVRRRERLVVDLPIAVDLLASCLAAGASVQSALPQVAAALRGPAGEELLLIAQRLHLGVAPEQVWGDLDEIPALAPLGRAMLRSHESGAPVQMAMQRLAGDLRDQAAAAVEARARSVEVRAAGPLGLCLLPAFVVLGIVPLVAGMFTALHLLG